MGSTPGSFVVFGDKLYFGATDGIHGRELWTYDGRDIQMVPELRVGSGSTFSGIAGFIGIVFGNELIFSATNGSTGEELWSFDGVQYRLLADINQTLINGVNQASSIAGFTVFGGELVFAADDGLHGREVWSYADGQVRMLTDLNPNLGPTGQTMPSLPLFFTVFGNDLVFQANNGTSGKELWSYDHLSVSQVADINPGTGSSAPQGLMVFGNELIFSANDGVTGIELWRLVHGSAGQ
jgi:ELWxxDGT repeat protein